MWKSILFSLLVLGSGSAALADDTLETKILALDKALFDAFNQRDVEAFKQYMAKDLEFYHDKAGVSGLEQTIGNIEDLASRNSDLTRTLVPEASEIYPVPDYGAMQIGQHEFCHTANEQKNCGTFKFLHLWQEQDGQWKITRVMSYDH